MTLMEGANAEGNSITYSAESLAALSDMDLDDLKERAALVCAAYGSGSAVLQR
jgi:hypothetical protein